MRLADSLRRYIDAAKKTRDGKASDPQEASVTPPASPVAQPTSTERRPKTPEPESVQFFSQGDTESGNELDWNGLTDSSSSVGLGAETFRLKVWTEVHGKIGDTLAFDTETEALDDKDRAHVPRYVVGQAYAGGDSVFFVKNTDLTAFFKCHENATLVMHHAPFDVEVCVQECGFDFHSQVVGDHLFDVGLLYRLYNLATAGKVPHRWSLDLIVKELLNVSISKDEQVRCTFGKYRQGQQVFYARISPAHLQYAAIDAIVTFQIFQKIWKKIADLGAENLLSHRIQLMGALGLRHIERLGIGVDLARKDQFMKELEASIQADLQKLSQFGYIPGEKGVQKAYERILTEQGVHVPKTATGKLSQQEEHLEAYRQTSPFVAAYLSYKGNEKLKATVEKLSAVRVHTRFDALKDTGRTGSSDPNLQNLPKTNIRDFFVSAPGHCLFNSDYSMIELRALGQICYKRYGYSKMRELINEGRDLHRWFAAIVTGKPEDEITKRERTYAKACNFGFPGGMGIPMFMQIAKISYGINDLTGERAKELKEIWLNAFPEMRQYLADTLTDRHDFSSLSWCSDPQIAVSIFKRIVGGATETTEGKPYSANTLSWAFGTVLSNIAPEYADIRQGSPEILNAVLRETAVTLTGRRRAKAGYSEARNTPFQGLAADGAKIALYNLQRAGFRVVNFIHDEVLIELPINERTLQLAHEAEKIFVGGMEQVVPDVEIAAEWKLLDRWYADKDDAPKGMGHDSILSKDDQGKFVSVALPPQEPIPVDEVAGDSDFEPSYSELRREWAESYGVTLEEAALALRRLGPG